MARLNYLDNLKDMLTFLVIFHHAGQAYGDGGEWGYTPSNYKRYRKSGDCPHVVCRKSADIPLIASDAKKITYARFLDAKKVRFSLFYDAN